MEKVCQCFICGKAYPQDELVTFGINIYSKDYSGYMTLFDTKEEKPICLECSKLAFLKVEKMKKAAMESLFNKTVVSTQRVPEKGDHIYEIKRMYEKYVILELEIVSSYNGVFVGQYGYMDWNALKLPEVTKKFNLSDIGEIVFFSKRGAQNHINAINRKEKGFE